MDTLKPSEIDPALDAGTKSPLGRVMAEKKEKPAKHSAAHSQVCTFSGDSEYEHALKCEGLHPGRMVFSLTITGDHSWYWDNDQLIKKTFLRFEDASFSAEHLRMTGLEIMKELAKAGEHGRRAISRFVEEKKAAWKVPKDAERLLVVQALYVETEVNALSGSKYPKTIHITLKLHTE
ncbi:hypothetical protein BJ508DRAFT_324726 [Ascobolus immersus RN42]|uniref:Uncharacterized protein n=1 Tax=Ascobolus immersus RN42 TaxID=1160509 RepID=A0A3N4IAL2_ASCIM|nr:hypothetical protein BJ508DRAFT_324726 [Ascobolus immersus RN42]